MSPSDTPTSDDRFAPCTGAAIQALRRTPPFAELSDEQAARVLGVAERRQVARATRLIRAGDPADFLFLVLRGRFTVMAGGQAIADIGAGEPIGEIGFFAGGARSADVVAARGSEVLMLGREAWNAVAQEVPGIAQAIMASLARRLATTSRGARALRPRAARCVALCGEVPPRVIAALRAGLPDWGVIEAGAADPRARQQQIEAEGRKVLFVAPSAGMLTEVDEVFDFAPLASSGARNRAPLPPGTMAQLVLWRDRADQPIGGTAALRQARQVAQHHHVALDQPADLDRLVRFVDGRALGLVLSGGGAQGTAHLGALKALGEHGMTFDMIGGTSAGAAMGAALALGRDPDMVMDLCEEIFLRSKAMGRYALPKYSILDPALYDAALREHFGLWDIEDLALPFFAVATNLSANDVAILDSGPLWQALRASTSIPVVFPPWIDGAGNVLVDGAMIDNAPILAMRARKPGPAILLNMLRDTDWRSARGYESLPTRAGTAWEVLSTPWRRGSGEGGFPTAISVLSRVFNVNAQRRLRGVDAPGDVMIDIEPLAGMAYLDWTKSRAQFDASYRAFSRALEQASAAGESPADPVAMMRATKAALPWAGPKGG
ncbi:patatin-like phospholipase family protein [Oceaniglobus trochenteri]|uniref:patatin-like phospholipase family protein n=1 Tax=Oceaniglobus trochenteri TaxID=2763260 RepID=UPI00247ADC58|nr:patatin-like phospholipase family protein [Oceaniglobus trochenteri]